ncbi:conserved virulence factor C family protein [Bacillus horti]|uniref:Scaffold protein Nfu/NifU N-terminal domain-containing protein n=1 Tax=Caldalkalibacillus horti TaxID=77523 RepID=A0ABT9W2C6_9BACI|nr:virulence factor [Bacillus horti]MDQ0167406.1 hypothetical protein [Bacillus horti]
MKILSIEPTPSPNSMKLNLDTSLEAGKALNFNKKNQKEAPAYIQDIMEIEGVTGVYQVNDFIALERHPKADWKEILAQVRDTVEKHSDSVESHTDQEAAEMEQALESFGEVQVFIQMFKGIPMQIKLLKDGEEHRVGLPDFMTGAAMKAQPAADNLVTERQWVDQGIRYGEIDEVGAQLVEELSAAYDEERLDRLVARAFQQDAKAEEEYSAEHVLKALEDEDWKVRYGALERMQLTLEEIPVLKKALTDSKMSIRRLATAYLGEVGGEHGSEHVLDLLVQALQDDSPVIRRTAGDAISDVGDPGAMGAMTVALKDKNKLVRWRAARYMYEVGTEEAIPALEDVQDDPEFEVSLQAKIALERIKGGEKAEGTVWQQMTRRNE